jgi:hypothetical protein
MATAMINLILKACLEEYATAQHWLMHAYLIIICLMQA